MTEAERRRLFALASDIDLAVLLPAEQRIHDILDVSSRLSEKLGRNVDLVDCAS